MKIKFLALAVGGFVLSGCYHVTVVHNKAGVTQQAAAAPVVVEKPFSHSFVYGLVAPAEVNVKDQCPRGVSKVETKQSFINGLVAGITYSLYTPLSVKVTCAQ
jgi:hypothetical protein